MSDDGSSIRDESEGLSLGHGPEEQPLIGTVAVVGFPNVGKSTLVNRLTGTRAAVVHETPGVTRDRKEIVCEWQGDRFLLIDTGGVDLADSAPMTRQIADQARAGIEDADLVLFVVDAKGGITPGDAEIADVLRRAKKPTLLLANKIDDPRQESTGARLPPARARRPACRSRRSTATAPAICSTRSSNGCRERVASRSVRRRSASRSSAVRTSASRRC